MSSSVWNSNAVISCVTYSDSDFFQYLLKKEEIAILIDRASPCAENIDKAHEIAKTIQMRDERIHAITHIAVAYMKLKTVEAFRKAYQVALSISDQIDIKNFLKHLKEKSSELSHDETTNFVLEIEQFAENYIYKQMPNTSIRKQENSITINRFENLPEEILSKIFYHLHFKDASSLEQTCIEMNDMINQKGIWWTLCSQYGFSKNLDNIKVRNIKLYLSYHTISTPSKLVDKLTDFFLLKCNPNNVYFKCLFKEEIGVIEVEKLQDTQEKNSITLLYNGIPKEDEKLKMKEETESFLSMEEIIMKNAFKKNIRL